MPASELALDPAHLEVDVDVADVDVDADHRSASTHSRRPMILKK